MEGYSLFLEISAYLSLNNNKLILIFLFFYSYKYLSIDNFNLIFKKKKVLRKPKNVKKISKTSSTYDQFKEKTVVNWFVNVFSLLKE
jgi:hypothetical protein